MVVAHTFEKNLRFHKKLEDNSEFEGKCLVEQFGDKNSNFLRNLRFEKISAFVAPWPGILFNMTKHLSSIDFNLFISCILNSV